MALIHNKNRDSDSFEYQNDVLKRYETMAEMVIKTREKFIENALLAANRVFELVDDCDARIALDASKTILKIAGIEQQENVSSNNQTIINITPEHAQKILDAASYAFDS